MNHNIATMYKLHSTMMLCLGNYLHVHCIGRTVFYTTAKHNNATGGMCRGESSSTLTSHDHQPAGTMHCMPFIPTCTCSLSYGYAIDAREGLRALGDTEEHSHQPQEHDVPAPVKTLVIAIAFHTIPLASAQ